MLNAYLSVNKLVSHFNKAFILFTLDVRFVSNKFYSSLLFVADGPEKYHRLPVTAKI